MLVEKLVLFFHAGAIACIWPFLNLHLLHNGASIQTTSISVAIVSLIGLFGVPLVSYILKRIENYRLILISNVIISLIAYNILLILAPGEKHGGKSLEAQLYCSHTGLTIYIPKCESNLDSCVDLLSQDHWMHLNIDNCSCVQVQNKEINEPKNIICFQGNGHTNCEIIDNFYNSDSILVEYSELNLNHSDTTCQFKTERAMVRDNRIDSVYCLDCNIHCFASTHVASPSESLLASGQALSSSWYFQYILIRGIAEMTSSAATFLLMTSGDNTELISMSAFAIFSPISGAFADWASVASGKKNFEACFYSMTALMIPTICLSFLLNDNHIWFPSLLHCHRRMLHHDKEFFWFFGVTLMLGCLWGYSDTFLPIFFESLCADKTFIGMTAVAAFLPALPVLLKSSYVIEKTSSTACIIVAFIAYAARFTAYVFVSDVRWSLLVECIRCMCLQLPWLALVHHTSKIVPRDMQASAQLLTMLLHFNFGRAMGCLIGGYLTHRLGFVEVFMIMATLSGLTSCIYFFTNIIFFFNRNFDI